MTHHNRFIFIICFSLLSGCIYKGKKAPLNLTNTNDQIVNPVLLPQNAEVNYENLHKYILKPKCISCHSGETPDGDVGLSSYDEILNHPFYYVVVPGYPEESSLYQSVKDDSMPPEGRLLSQEEKNFLKKWIELNGPK